MADFPSLTLAPVTPQLTPIAEVFDLKISKPAGGKSKNHVAGQVVGATLSYGDVYAFAWFASGGWQTMNRGRKGLRRVHRGTEDSFDRQG